MYIGITHHHVHCVHPYDGLINITHKVKEKKIHISVMPVRRSTCFHFNEFEGFQFFTTKKKTPQQQQQHILH